MESHYLHPSPPTSLLFYENILRFPLWSSGCRFFAVTRATDANRYRESCRSCGEATQQSMSPFDKARRDLGMCARCFANYRPHPYHTEAEIHAYKVGRKLKRGGRCLGVKKDGKRCRQRGNSSWLDENGYCPWHGDQAPVG